MKLRLPTREWLRLRGRCSVGNDGSLAIQGKDGSTPPLNSSSRHEGPPWTNGTAVLGAEPEGVITTIITEYMCTATREPVTLSESIDDHHSDLVTIAGSSTTTATPSSPLPPSPADTNGPAQTQSSSLPASVTTVSSTLPSPSPTQAPASEVPSPTAPPSASSPLQTPTSTETERQDLPGIEHQNPPLESSEPSQPAAASSLPPLPDVNISQPGSSITWTSISESSMPLVTPVGGHTTSSSSISQPPAPPSTPTDITMTPTLTTAPSASSISKTWPPICSVIPPDSRCPEYSTWTTPKWMLIGTETGSVGCNVGWITGDTACPTTTSSSTPTTTTTMASAPITTPTPTSSFTCIGNSETCYCISGSCTMKSTFETRPLSGVLVPPKSTSTATSTAELNTTVPIPTTNPASPPYSIPILPIALGITTPLAFVILFLFVCYSWRHLHPSSYAIYAQYCPLHRSFRAFSTVNARWKETREKNRDVRNLEKSLAAAKMLRRYELERTRRRVEVEEETYGGEAWESEKSPNYRNGGGFGEVKNGDGAGAGRARGRGRGRGRKTPDLAKRDVKGKAKGTEKDRDNAVLEKKPSWEEAWRRLGSDGNGCERRGTPLDTNMQMHGRTPRNRHADDGDEDGGDEDEDEDEDEDAIAPASPGTTMVGSERRGSDRSGEHGGWI